MDEIVSSAQHEQSEGISILPESSYDIILSQAGQIAPPTNEDPGFQEHVNRYIFYVYSVTQVKVSLFKLL